MKKTYQNSNNWSKRIEIVTRVLLLDISKSDCKRLERPLYILEKFHRCRGTNGVKLWKSVSDFMTRWIVTEKHPGEDALRSLRYRVRNNVPVHFSVFWKLARKSRLHKILVLTLLQSHRLYKSKGIDYSIKTITNQSRFSLHQFLEERWEAPFLRLGFWKQVQGVPSKIENWRMEWSFKSKGGPNGTPAICHYRKDFHGVSTERFYKPLLGLLRSLLRRNYDTYKANAVERFIDSLVKEVEEHGQRIRSVYAETRKPLRNSKLSFLREKSGKTRVVAIGDVWSQFALKPVHDQIFLILRRVFSICDGTFDQDSQKRRVAKWAKQDRKIYSFDLSAATDRLPLAVQRRVLDQCKFLSGREVDFWQEIMGSREFIYIVPQYQKTIQNHPNIGKMPKEGVRNGILTEWWKTKFKGTNKVKSFTIRWSKVKKCSYTIGQPMGLLSSFGMLALTHHIIVQMAAFSAGKFRNKPTNYMFTKYALLGDDIAIVDDDVAEHYTKIMYELGVNINLSKSYVGNGLGEFAKALFSKGLDVTPLPSVPLSLRKECYIEDAMLIHESLRKREIPVNLLSFVTTLSRWRKEIYWLRVNLIMNLTNPKYAYRHDDFELLWDPVEVDIFDESLRIGTWVKATRAVHSGKNQISIIDFDPFPLTFHSWVGPREQFERNVALSASFEGEADFRILVGDGFVTWSFEGWKEYTPINILNVPVREIRSRRDSKDNRQRKFVGKLSKMNILRFKKGLVHQTLSMVGVLT